MGGASDLNALIGEPAREDIDQWKGYHHRSQEDFEDLDPFAGVFPHRKGYAALPKVDNERCDKAPQSSTTDCHLAAPQIGLGCPSLSVPGIRLPSTPLHSTSCCLESLT